VTVYLVGAGPGDPGLLTRKAASLLAEADAVVHDRLVDPRVLELVPATARRVDVGKRPGSARVRQKEINELLVALGRELRTVVRLKGGDPFVFGRGGEEAAALAAAGVDYDVVPGVSAATGVPAAAGVPLTHRGLATSFTVVTGHLASEQGAGPTPDWAALARSGGTIVVLMGAARREEIVAELLEAGCDPATPVAAVEQGSLPGERVVRTRLAELATTEIGAPATLVIGAVAGLDLGFDRRLPLLGWRVVVTRTREQASVLSEQLARAGARPVEVPAIEVADPPDGGRALAEALARVEEFDWVVFSSANAVARAFRHLRDARALGAVRVAAIGDGTAGELARRGVAADLVPPRFVAESLVDAFPGAPSGARRGRVLVPRAAAARDVLPAGLEAKGWSVEVVVAYETRPARLAPEALAAVDGADAVAFTSSSTVTGFLQVAGIGRVPPVVACIGPVTASTARAAGLEVAVEAAEHSIAGLVRGLVDHARAHGRPATGPARPGGRGAPARDR
jgi:uroporphyrinogen III methyltransferase/synthase